MSKECQRHSRCVGQSVIPVSDKRNTSRKWDLNVALPLRVTGLPLYHRSHRSLSDLIPLHVTGLQLYHRSLSDLIPLHVSDLPLYHRSISDLITLPKYLHILIYTATLSLWHKRHSTMTVGNVAQTPFYMTVSSVTQTPSYMTVSSVTQTPSYDDSRQWDKTPPHNHSRQWDKNTTIR